MKSMSSQNYFELAEYYEYDHAFDFDLPFYEAYAQQCQSPILELACGTGRLVVPLAQAGFEVYGLDKSPAMLERCQTTVNNNDLQDQVSLHLADMANFKLPREDFGLIFVALRSFMHLLTRPDQISCLQRVYEHLAPGGTFIVDIVAPDLNALAERPSQFYSARNDFELPNGHRVVRQIRLVEHDYVNQIRHFEFKFEEYDTAGRLAEIQRMPVSTRYLFRYELQLLFESTGFELIHVFRDYDRNPYDGTGEMIVVCQKMKM